MRVRNAVFMLGIAALVGCSDGTAPTGVTLGGPSGGGEAAPGPVAAPRQDPGAPIPGTPGEGMPVPCVNNIVEPLDGPIKGADC